MESSKHDWTLSWTATVALEENISIKETAITKNTKMATNFDLMAFHGKLFNLSNLIF